MALLIPIEHSFTVAVATLQTIERRRKKLIFKSNLIGTFWLFVSLKRTFGQLLGSFGLFRPFPALFGARVPLLSLAVVRRELACCGEIQNDNNEKVEMAQFELSRAQSSLSALVVGSSAELTQRYVTRPTELNSSLTEPAQARRLLPTLPSNG